ncbi:MAG: AMP-binding protein [Dorea sp.]
MRQLINSTGYSADDKIIAVSSYDFDLSVYDIFGILSAGGTLILIKDSNSRDAEVWLDIAERHSVTLVEFCSDFIEYAVNRSGRKGKEIPSLRLAMLSGDWIGMDIPERLNHVAKKFSSFIYGWSHGSFNLVQFF